MKKFVCVAGLLMVLGSGTSALAQAPADGWQVTLSPYLVGASMSGVSALRGVEVDVDVSASDIFSNLQFGAMGFLVARKGNWGVGGDFIWMALGTSTERPPANIDMDQRRGAGPRPRVNPASDQAVCGSTPAGSWSCSRRTSWARRWLACRRQRSWDSKSFTFAITWNASAT
jgi:hypothetical protein